MNYYIITGTSRGIGKALAEALLQNDQNVVHGVSRRKIIEHPNYIHHPLDLSDLDGVEHNFQKIFLPFKDADKVVLVNNAGVIGEVGYVGEFKDDHFEFVFDTNLISPAILMNEFLRHYAQLPCLKVILNISSGAGKYPIDGWAAYCASKAALDMLSLTVQKEQDLRGNQVKVFALAPGVVDTAMQEHIRESEPNSFSTLQKFHDYKEQSLLSSPEDVAEKMLKLLDNPERYKDVVMRIDEV
ncbi:MAG: SDR family NAD(P)-dependent oxidoreductase [Hymenobacteraceae bacterium]|nr:SDR family NAD(P)-dependent oxidoreductase [Hymenobacteraceae bacterium]MDX5395954.1 SDR family NAD(P)-dependent oxidoreductase [Hymenobacteraceae bacterium]MDX5512015.1 SDR family NAD(P)-dependent oxidoreductase [Hymenobacteraceae bacterium]